MKNLIEVVSVFIIGFISGGAFIACWDMQSNWFCNAISKKVVERVTTLYEEKSKINSKVSYSNYYNRKNAERTDTFHWGPDKNPTFSSYEEADSVLAAMNAVARSYGNVSVQDLYDFCGLTSKYTDTKYGWTVSDFNKCGITRECSYYYINFPNTTKL